MTATQTATPSKTTTWEVDPAHNHVEFAAKVLVLATVRGRLATSLGP
jgi:polyisoprenoid-binding protein YceI